MFIYRRHIGVRVPWPLLLVAAPLWLGAGMIYLTVWSMVALVRLAVWAVSSGTATYRHQPRPAAPRLGAPPEVWRGYRRSLLDDQPAAAADIAGLTWRDARWWRTPVRDLINRPTPKDPR